MKLIADPLKIGMLIGSKFRQRGRQKAIVLLQGFEDRAGRQIQLGQAASVIFHLFDELEGRKLTGHYSRRRSGRDGAQSGALLGLEAHFLQAFEEAPVDFIDSRLQETRQALKMKA